MAMRVENRTSPYPKLPPIDLGFGKKPAQVNSLENRHHVAGGGNKKIFDARPKWNARSKINSLDESHLKRPSSYHSDPASTDIRKIKFTRSTYDRLKHENREGNWEHYHEDDNEAYAYIKNKKFFAKPKVGSLDNKNHQAGGGNVKILNDRVEINAQSKIDSLDNIHYMPGGGGVKIHSEPVYWNAGPKVPFRENSHHQPLGGNKQIYSQTPRWNAKSKVNARNDMYSPKCSNVKIVNERQQYNDVKPVVGSLSNIDHKAGGGNVNIVDDRTSWNAGPKIDANNYNYSPEGGNVQIPQHERPQYQVTSKINSLDNKYHIPGGGNKPIHNEPTHFEGRAKVGSLQILKTYKPKGGDTRIVDDPQKYQARSVIDAQNPGYVPAGGNVEIFDRKTEYDQSPRIDAYNQSYMPGGGDLKVRCKVWPWEKVDVCQNISPYIDKKLKSPRGMSSNAKSGNTSRSSGYIKN